MQTTSNLQWLHNMYWSNNIGAVKNINIGRNNWSYKEMQLNFPKTYILIVIGETVYMAGMTLIVFMFNGFFIIIEKI